MERGEKWEDWFGFFAFLLLWVKGGRPRHCSATRKTSNQRSQIKLSFHSLLLFQLTKKRSELTKRMKEGSQSGVWLGGWIGGLWAALQPMAPPNEANPSKHTPHQPLLFNSLFLKKRKKSKNWMRWSSETLPSFLHLFFSAAGAEEKREEKREERRVAGRCVELISSILLVSFTSFSFSICFHDVEWKQMERKEIHFKDF